MTVVMIAGNVDGHWVPLSTARTGVLPDNHGNQ